MPPRKPPARAGRTAATRAEMQGTNSLVINGELVLYGIVDSIDDWGGGTIRAVDVMASLAELGVAETIVCRLNSPGGSVIEGLAIFNALRAWGKPIQMHIDAYAGSIASIIAMAGTDIVMAENASMMIHDPWGVALGGSDEMRAAADEIDRLKAILINIYADRTGLDPADIDTMMTAETTMSAADAVEKGFADRVDTPLRIAAMKPLAPADLRRLLTSTPIRAHRADPAPRAVPPQEHTMPQPSSAADLDAARTDAVRAERERRTAIKNLARDAGLTDAAGDELVDAGHSVDEAKAKIAEAVVNRGRVQPDETSIRNQAVQAERERVHGITAAVRAARLDATFADDLIRDGVPLAEAQTRVMARWSDTQNARQDNPGGRGGGNHVRVETDGVERWMQGATAGLLARAGMRGGERNEFTGLSLVELARSALSARNIKAGSMDRMTMVGAAFTARNAGPGYHSTSDFGNVLASVAHRAVMLGYEEVDETFDQWTAKGTASDFRPINRVDLGLFPSLDKVEEGVEYKYGTIGDTGTTVQLATYGKLFAITRQAIINDDLQFFDRVPRRMGRAAKRTIGNLVYAILNANPTMQDGVALFAAGHGNLASSGSVISVTSIGAMQAAMARQKDDAGIGTGVGVRSKFLLVPPELVMLANQVLTSATIPGDAGQITNPVRNTAAAISDSRLSGTAWYLAADPQQTDTIEVTYLDGVDTPFMDQKEGWDVDGSEFKVRIDAGVKALHWRGLAKNPGA